MKVTLYTVIEMDLNDGTAHSFTYAYNEWNEAVNAVIEETGITDEKELAVLDEEGFAEVNNRKYFIETLLTQIETSQEIEDDACSMLYGVDNNQ